MQFVFPALLLTLLLMIVDYYRVLFCDICREVWLHSNNNCYIIYSSSNNKQLLPFSKPRHRS